MFLRRILVVAMTVCLSATTLTSAESLKVLIIDGQNNHGDWPKTTAIMRHYLEQTGRFDVNVARTRFTWQGKQHFPKYALNDKQYESLDQPKSDPDFAPKFSDYDVVVSNFGHNAAAWPEATQAAFEDFVSSGGGLVVVHAADNSFPDWKEFNRMIGLGGWGGRNEKSGPYVFFDADGKEVRDTSAGGGGHHGAQHEFQVIVRQPDHPIVAGLPRNWLHTKDELYEQLRGPAERMTVLATAFASKKHGGSGRHEPMLMTIEYGDGRVFHTPMGHADYSMECAGFATLLVRGTEWAATGNVTLTAVPEDFPTADASSRREFVPLQN